MESIRDKIKTIKDKLIIISTLKEKDKLIFSDFNWEISESWLFQPLVRKYKGENRERTIQHINELYMMAFNQLEILKQMVILNLPLQRSSLTTLEIDAYLDMKNCLDDLNSWLDKSLLGLNNLIVTYPNEAHLKSLKDEIKRYVEIGTKFAFTIDTAYQKITSKPEEMKLPVGLSPVAAALFKGTPKL